MQKILIYSALLILGLVGSQFLPPAGEGFDARDLIRWGTFIALAYIMINVGYEFDIDKKNPRKYAWDYVVACTAAGFPWIFAAAYFVFVLKDSSLWGNVQVWKEALLTGRFAAPTSAGVLFTMLAAAGLASTWLFQKARILAIFDDIDTVLFMIPLKALMIGSLVWQLWAIMFIMAGQLAVAWIFLHRVKLPTSWFWILVYSIVIVAICEGIHAGSVVINDAVPVHLEVLLPAFVLGCIIKRPQHTHAQATGGHEALGTPADVRVGEWISAMFMVLVGLSMPGIAEAMSGGSGGSGGGASAAAAAASGAAAPAATTMSWGMIAAHVLAVTFLANLGKMFPALCYRKEAPLRERLAVAIGMWPRGEVGAGVLVVSLSYGIGGPMVVIGMLSLALNLLLTGVFIVIVKALIGKNPTQATPEVAHA